MSQTVQTAAPAIGCDGGLQQHAETIRRLELEGDGERTKSSASWFVRSLVFVVGCNRDLQQDARVQTLVMTLRVSCETVLQGGCLTGGLSCKRVVLQGGCLARGLSCKRVVLQGGGLAREGITLVTDSMSDTQKCTPQVLCCLAQQLVGKHRLSQTDTDRQTDTHTHTHTPNTRADCWRNDNNPLSHLFEHSEIC